MRINPPLKITFEQLGHTFHGYTVAPTYAFYYVPFVKEHFLHTPYTDKCYHNIKLGECLLTTETGVY